MVKEYKKPEFKTVVFEAEDVITTSNPDLPIPDEGEATRCVREGTCLDWDKGPAR